MSVYIELIRHEEDFNCTEQPERCDEAFYYMQIIWKRYKENYETKIDDCNFNFFS